MTDHLTPDLLNALADGELSSDQLASVNEHLAQCPSCTSSALVQSLLKSAIARAGQRYAPPPHLQQRLARIARQQSAPQQTSNPARRSISPLSLSGWATACVLLLAFASVAIFERQAHQSAIVSTESAALITEACDQHIATLAANEPPQVISTDRHTVKPWFQGKLPFSFNLPDNLPADTKLEGANLTYLHNQPAALLLYSIGKHRVSVFVLQRLATGQSLAQTADQAGFHAISFRTKDLDGLAVSDADPIRLSNLTSQIEQAQAGSSPQPR
jgi:anti-sigma factor RsiW